MRLSSNYINLNQPIFEYLVKGRDCPSQRKLQPVSSDVEDLFSKAKVAGFLVTPGMTAKDLRVFSDRKCCPKKLFWTGVVAKLDPARNNQTCSKES
jgi:hypothetical protein